MLTGPRLLLRAVTIVVGVLLVGAVAPAGAAQAQAQQSARASASLAIRVSGLPPGTAAKVQVRGPRFSKTVKGSKTFRGVRAGRYTLTVRQVKIAGRPKGLQAGSLALPAQSRTRVRVKTGRAATVKLRYGSIVNANVKRPNLGSYTLQGDAESPSALVVAASTRVRAGMILTVKPSSKLPAGLFHKVTAVRRSGRTLVVSLRPARLAEAFPQLDIDSTLKLTPGKVAVGRAGMSGFDPLVGSVGIGNFRCSQSVAGSHLNARHSLALDAGVELHIPKKWGIPVGLPYGQVSLTMSGSASLDTLIRKNNGCNANAQFPPLSGVIPVGPVLVPVYAQVGLAGTLSFGDDLKQHAATGFSLRAGMSFRGSNFQNISTSSGYAEASASGVGKIAVGPTVRFAVGAARLADVHVDVKPSFAFSAALDYSCSFDFLLGSQVGISFGPFEINQNLPAPTKNLYRCPPHTEPGPDPSPDPSPTETPGPLPSPTTVLELEHTGPLAAFPNQAFDYAIRVTNSGPGTARDVSVTDTLPADGSFISSSSDGTPASPAPGDHYTIDVGDLTSGESKTVTVRWRAPWHDATLTGSASVQSSNAPDKGPADASVPVGITAKCNPCGADAAGTGLRNRDHGSINITGIPSGATVGRAVLVWGILYNGAVPASTITFDGHRVSADVTSSVSGTLGWGDTATVGYAADVTSYVTGNGTFDITDPPRGTTRPDADPGGALPLTDGATLIVYYTGIGVQNQVISDFAYDTDTDADNSISRTFAGINSVGGPASLILAGPGGQVGAEAGETFDFTGADIMTLANTFGGSDLQDGPSFEIGNLWDTDRYFMTDRLTAGQQVLQVDHSHSGNRIGVGAAVLQVSQRSPYGQWDD